MKYAWFQGGWFDALSALWREVSTETFRPNRGTGNPGREGQNGGSILLKDTLKQGEKTTYPILIAWHFPNCHYNASCVSN